MSVNVWRVEYFRAQVEDAPGTAYDFLRQLSSHDVNLLAIHAVPVGPTHTQFTLFPEHSEKLIEVAQRANLTLMGPEQAILIRGDDQLGALVEYHRKLADARINIYAAYGVTDGRGGYGYVIHVRRDDLDMAATKLGAD